MAYSTTDDLKLRLGSNASASMPGDYQWLTNRLGGTDGNDTVAAAAIAHADARMDSYIAGAGYATPIDSDDAGVVSLLNSHSLDIAVYLLWKDHPSRKTIPERIQAAYDDAVAWLEALAAGTVALPASTSLPETAAGGPHVSYGGWESKLTEDALEAF